MRSAPEVDEEKGVTVNEYAAEHSCSVSKVRYHILRGSLSVDDSSKPMRVVGGRIPDKEIPLRSQKDPRQLDLFEDVR